MNGSLICSIFLTLILSTQAWGQGQSSTTVVDSTEATPRFSAQWKVGLSGRDTKDIESQSKLVDLRLDLMAEYKLTSSLLLDLQPSLRLQSGQTQSVDGADKAENKIALSQAAVHYVPFKFLRGSAGALNQRALHTTLLVDDLAFPAARLESRFKGDSVLTGVAIETAIPTSTSLSTNTQELEPTPGLNTASVKFNWQASRDVTLKTQVGYFIYSNLPSAVAKDSGFIGNKVDALSTSNYEFSYDYQGLEAAASLNFPVIKHLDLEVGGEYINNQKAPSDLSSGSQLFVAGDVHLSKSLDLYIKTAYFSIAPEAAVAYFNASNYETNRVGYSIESKLFFKKEGFNIGVKYSDANVMFEDLNQSRKKSIMIKLETFYASI